MEMLVMFLSGVRRPGLLFRRLLTIAYLALGMIGLGSVGADAATPLQLFREVFRSAGVAGSIVSGNCINGGGNFTFSVSGTAYGPYPGTFTESGSFSITNKVLSAFSASFTITSSAGNVTGTKSLQQGQTASCFQEGSGTRVSTPDNFIASYTATTTGTDQVTGTSSVTIDGLLGSPPNFFEERFGTSCQGLCQKPGMPPPTSKSQCRHGGWKVFGTMFKNQGDCVSFVATGGNNPPSGS
jgi:hypothetical protein